MPVFCSGPHDVHMNIVYFMSFRCYAIALEHVLSFFSPIYKANLKLKYHFLELIFALYLASFYYSGF